MKKQILVFLFTSILATIGWTASEPDSNFHIYLCFGQSNMEGQGVIETMDLTVNPRFQVFQAVECPESGHVKDRWRSAVPPLCQCHSGLSPADYFGRTMVENTSEAIKIGIVNVAIGGCDIRIFDKAQYQDYDSTYTANWFVDKVKLYGGNPYTYLIEKAKLAQKSGVIKGILLHQGETNTGDVQWPNYVAKIYQDMLMDLNLDAASTPLLAGEVVSVENSCCGTMNSIIRTLPTHIENAHVISSADCTAMDAAHFDSEGYRELGRRYAFKMLEVQD